MEQNFRNEINIGFVFANVLSVHKRIGLDVYTSSSEDFSAKIKQSFKKKKTKVVFSFSTKLV